MKLKFHESMKSMGHFALGVSKIRRGIGGVRDKVKPLRFSANANIFQL